MRKQAWCGELEDDVGVGAGGHAQIEADGTAELVQMQDGGGVGFGLQAAAAEEDEGNLLQRGAGDETKIGERGGGVGVERGIEDEAGLTGTIDADGALVAEMRGRATFGSQKNNGEPRCRETHHAL